MKKKDIITLAITVVILLVAGYFAYTQLLSPKGSSGSGKGTSVEVIGSISSSLNQDSLTTLQDPTKTQDFTPKIDLTTGLNNTAPFGQ